MAGENGNTAGGKKTGGTVGNAGRVVEHDGGMVEDWWLSSGRMVGARENGGRPVEECWAHDANMVEETWNNDGRMVKW
eukprot:4766343-Lingulodinium_polyedra.AAC.1